MKKMLAILLAGTMVLSALTGCNAKKETAKTEDNKETQKVTEEAKATPAPTTETKEEEKDYSGKTLRIGWWGGDARNEQTMKMIDEFEAQYPGLTVEVEFAGFADYFTRLNTQAAGGELPDVMQMDVGKIYNFANSGQLLELQSFIDDGKFDTTNVSDSAIDMGRVCGGIYGVACGMNGLTCLYNPELLKKAGCTLSMEPTLSEFMNVAKTVYEKTGARTHSIPEQIFYRSLGGDTYKDGEDAFGFTEDMLLERAKLYLQAVQDGYMTTPDNQVEPDTASQIAAEEIWCILESSNQIVSYESASGKTLEMVTQPKADNATVEHPTYMKPAMLWSVAADTELSELAVAFLDYYTNATSVYDICGIDRGVPISSAICDYLLPNLSEADKKSFAYVDYLRENSTPINLYVPAKGGEAKAVLDEIFEKIQYNAITMEELSEAVHEAYVSASEIIAAK